MWVKFRAGYTVKGGARTSFKMGESYDMSQASADHFIRRQLADPCSKPSASQADVKPAEIEKTDDPPATPDAPPETPAKRGRKGRQKTEPLMAAPDPNAAPEVADLKTVFGDDPGGESP